MIKKLQIIFIFFESTKKLMEKNYFLEQYRIKFPDVDWLNEMNEMDENLPLTHHNFFVTNISRIPKEIRGDIEFVKGGLKTFPDLIFFLPEELKNDFNVIIDLMNINVKVYDFIRYKFKYSNEILKIYVTKSEILNFDSYNFKNLKAHIRTDILADIIKKQPAYSRYLERSDYLNLGYILKKDRKLAFSIASFFPKAMRCFPEVLKRNRKLNKRYEPVYNQYYEFKNKRKIKNFNDGLFFYKF